MDYAYEKLDVWKKAMDFTISIISTVTPNAETTKHPRIAQALEESSMTIATAIAEGKSFASRHDFTRHLFISRGAVYKTMTLLAILKRKKLLPDESYADLDAAAQRLTAMLSALIKSISAQKPDHAKPAQ
jgi:four helix bundle protein